MQLLTTDPFHIAIFCWLFKLVNMQPRIEILSLNKLAYFTPPFRLNIKFGYQVFKEWIQHEIWKYFGRNFDEIFCYRSR